VSRSLSMDWKEGVLRAESKEGLKGVEVREVC
jgi:hypothetical protein